MPSAAFGGTSNSPDRAGKLPFKGSFFAIAKQIFLPTLSVSERSCIYGGTLYPYTVLCEKMRIL